MYSLSPGIYQNLFVTIAIQTRVGMNFLVCTAAEIAIRLKACDIGW